MEITNVTTYILRVPVSSPITDAYFSHKMRNHVFVEISTGEGISGLGEACQYFAVSSIPPLINEGFKPYLLGQDPFHIETLWDTLYRRSFLYGRKGNAIIALSAIEIALWDIVGKSLRLPLHKLLGGKFVDKVKAYASGGFYKPDAELVKEMESLVQRGFKAVKMKVGFDPHKDVERVKLVRKAIGHEVELIIDANMGYNPSTAKLVAKKLEDQDILWFEEPVSADDIDGLAYVRKHSNIPVAAGENEYTEYGFSDLIRKRAVDIVQADVTRCGGVLQAKKIAGIAKQHGMAYAPHVFGSLVGFVASLHVISSQPNGYLLEYDQTQNPLREKVIDERFVLDKGFVHVPDKPGIGLDLPQEMIEEYQEAS